MWAAPDPATLEAMREKIQPGLQVTLVAGKDAENIYTALAATVFEGEEDLLRSVMLQERADAVVTCIPSEVGRGRSHPARS